MNKLYVVLISENYVRDAQILDIETIPDDLNYNDDEAMLDYACNPINDCWRDCFGGIFVDVVRATSDDDAIEVASRSSGYDKRILTSICISKT